jgi:hypothetical protein
MSVPITVASEFDSEMLKAELQEAVKVGRNRLVVEYDHADYPVLGSDLQSVSTILPPVPKLRLMGRFIVGDNGLKKAGAGRVSPVSWAKLGLSLYSGTSRYTAEVDLSGEWIDPRVSIEFSSLASVAVVRVNGADAGTVAWRPRQLRIGPHLREGCNRIEIDVTNTQANMMYEEPAPSGILGPVSLVRARAYTDE